ncbi:hypothetical protein FRC02_004738 [Tulasnella sp. 418]|nr:hypothetical protein FRC02_004738 [Tulasnella sp. 418]
MMSHLATSSKDNPYTWIIPTYIPPMVFDDSGLPLYIPSTKKLVKSLSMRVHYADDPWNSAKCYNPDPFKSGTQHPNNVGKVNIASNRRKLRRLSRSNLADPQSDTARAPHPLRNSALPEAEPIPPISTAPSAFTAYTVTPKIEAHETKQKDPPESQRPRKSVRYADPIDASIKDIVALPPTQTRRPSSIRKPAIRRRSLTLPPGPTSVGMRSSKASTPTLFSSGLFTTDQSETLPQPAPPHRPSASHSKEIKESLPASIAQHPSKSADPALFFSGLFTLDQPKTLPQNAPPNRPPSNHSDNTSQSTQNTALPAQTLPIRRHSDEIRLPSPTSPEPSPRPRPPRSRPPSLAVLPNHSLFPSRSNTVKTCWSQPSEYDRCSTSSGTITPGSESGEHFNVVEWDVVEGILDRSRRARRSIDSESTDESSVKLGVVTSSEPSILRTISVHSETFFTDSDSESFSIDMDEIRRREAEQEQEWEEKQMREVTELVMKRLARQ